VECGLRASWLISFGSAPWSIRYLQISGMLCDAATARARNRRFGLLIKRPARPIQTRLTVEHAKGVHRPGRARTMQRGVAVLVLGGELGAVLDLAASREAVPRAGRSPPHGSQKHKCPLSPRRRLGQHYVRSTIRAGIDLSTTRWLYAVF
jgi:hypothetical protein